MYNADDVALSPQKRVNRLFHTALAVDASLEWEAGRSPRVSLRREDGPSRELAMGPLSTQEMSVLLQSILTDQQRTTLEQTGTLEFSHAPDANGPALRVRVSSDGGNLRVAGWPLAWGDAGEARFPGSD